MIKPEVMIVDDEAAIRSYVVTLLSTKGMSALAVESGADCLAALESGFRGVILVDLNMPGLSGWETITAINDRGLLSDNIIIILTGMGEADPPTRELSALVTDYVSKPFNGLELAESIEGYLAFLA